MSTMSEIMEAGKKLIDFEAAAKIRSMPKKSAPHFQRSAFVSSSQCVIRLQ